MADCKGIPYGKQHITDEDIEAVVNVLRSDFLTQGPKISEFEDAFASYVGCEYALAVSNGTAALHLCMLALGIKPGDKVITSPITFAASANCVRYCGGEVVFSDIDPETYLLDIEGVRNLLFRSPKGTYKGIVLVNFAGRVVNLEEYSNLAQEFGLWVVEDACHSPGGFFVDSENRVQKSGNGKFADFSIFSFHPVKHIAAGEGGMVTTNNEMLYRNIQSFRSHGITRDEFLFRNSMEFAVGSDTVNPPSSSSTFPAWYMEMQELGYNYRLTDFQAALGLSQLQRAGLGLDRRREIANTYHEAFQDKSFVKGQSGLVDGHAYHLYIVELENRYGLFQYLRDNNIFSQIHYVPLHLMPYYRQFGWKEGDMPFAEMYYKKCISLPMFPALTDREQEIVINTLLIFYHA